MLNDHGSFAIGLSGEDAGLLTAERRGAIVDGEHVDIGQVGDVVAVDPSAMTALIDAGRIPVIATVARGVYPDPRQKDPKLLVVDLEAGRGLPRPVTLAEMRANPKLAGFDLLRLPRLSVMPVSAAQWAEILRMARG